MKTITTYTQKDFSKMARDTLTQYRKVHNDRIRRYVFAEIPWFVSISDNSVTLNVQIMNRETHWVENWNIGI